MKKVLITGANSYIGMSFEAWAKKEHPGEFQIDTVDMIDGSWREKSFAGYDAVFHVAGIAHADVGKVSEERKAFYYKINRDLAIETAEKAKSDCVGQFVLMSSMIIYGESAGLGKRKIVTKETKPHPANFYGDSKWQADKGVRKLGSDSFHVAVLRPPMIYGKGSKGNYPLLAKMAKKLPVFPDIKNERSMLYIDNLCEFLCLLMQSGEAGIYFPQNAEYVRTSEMVREIAKAAGHKIWITKLLNSAVWIAGKIPGKISGMVNKAFGNSCYVHKMSIYEELNYQKVSLKESIEKTEGNPMEINEERALKDLVSIITPAYNCEATIRETIESVIAQTYTNWEMIIVNDCSRDHTVDIVNNYVKKDARIKLINLKNNSGSAVARNAALEIAKGKYVALLDSDDLWKTQKLEKQIMFMKNNNYAFSFTAYEVFRNSNDKERRVYEVPCCVKYEQYLSNTIIGCLTVVVDRAQITDFHMEKGYLEDILTWMYYLRNGVIAYGLNENLASYRIVPGSKSSNKIANAKRYFKCLRLQPGLSFVECVIHELG